MPANRGWSIAAMAVIIVALLALVLVVALSGPVPPKVHVEPEVTFALPPTSAGCGGDTLTAGGVTRVPLTVSTVAGQTAETLDVCIGGQGPYPFVLDSGAGQSTIDAGLAKRLHLASAGQSSTFAGVGCTGSAQPVASGSWSLEGVALSPQQLTAATLPQIGGKGEPLGLLGSDVLARFGAVRIDFAARALLLPGSEGAALSATSDYTGPLGPAPAALTLGQGTTVPLTVSPAGRRRVLERRRPLLRRHPPQFRRRHGFFAERGLDERGPEGLAAQEPSWRSARPPCARSSPSPWCTAGHGPSRTSCSIRSCSARPTSVPSPPLASTVCWGRTSCCATAGWCSTTRAGASCWAERAAYSGPDNPSMSVTPWSRPAV